MLILLPPSEGKSAARRGRPLDPAGLSFPGLAPQRERVATALADASARPDAHTLLGVEASLVEEVACNTRLFTSPTLPAEQLYIGVLYGALDLSRLDAAARRRARRWIVVISALYGAVRLTDRVAPYRLSMATSLPGLPRLATLWREPLDAALRRRSAAGWSWMRARGRTSPRGRHRATCRSGGCTSACPGHHTALSTPGV